MRRSRGVQVVVIKVAVVLFLVSLGREDPSIFCPHASL